MISGRDTATPARVAALSSPAETCIVGSAKNWVPSGLEIMAAATSKGTMC